MSEFSADFSSVLQLIFSLWVIIFFTFFVFRMMVRLASPIVYPMTTSRAHDLPTASQLPPDPYAQRIAWTAGNLGALWAVVITISLLSAGGVGYVQIHTEGDFSFKRFFYTALASMVTLGLVRLSVHLRSPRPAQSVVFALSVQILVIAIGLAATNFGYLTSSIDSNLMFKELVLLRPWLLPMLGVSALGMLIITESMPYLARWRGFMRDTWADHPDGLSGLSQKTTVVMGYSESKRLILAVLRGCSASIDCIRWVALTCPPDICEAIKEILTKNHSATITPDHLRIVAYDDRSNRDALKIFPPNCVCYINRIERKRQLTIGDNYLFSAFNASMFAYHEHVPRTNVLIAKTGYSDVMYANIMFDSWWERLHPKKTQHATPTNSHASKQVAVPVPRNFGGMKKCQKII